MRHRQHRSDPDLCEMTRRHPLIPVWDDHEIANNAWSDGVPHEEEVGVPFAVRFAAAAQAYREWMPIRDHEAAGKLILYRELRYGDAVRLLMLDTRMAGRTKQDISKTSDPAHTLLGEPQRAWLEVRLPMSEVPGPRWTLLAQQVRMFQLVFEGKRPSPDSWDGYAAERQRLLGRLQTFQAQGVVVLTGDVHSSWAAEVYLDPDAPSERPAAVEFITPSIASSLQTAKNEEALFRAMADGQLPHLKWANLRDRGYLLIDVQRDRVRAEWYFSRTVRRRTPEHVLGAAFETHYEDGKLIRDPGVALKVVAGEEAAEDMAFEEPLPKLAGVF